MSDVQESWKEVADVVEGLGLKLKLHLDQERDSDVPDKALGETKSAFDQLGGGIGDVFDAFGNATKDDAVHADVREIAELIKQALIATFRAVGAELGEIMDDIEEYAEDAAEKVADALGLDGDSDSDASDSDASDSDAPEASSDDGTIDPGDLEAINPNQS